jgi:glycosyltransferase involved in cell wall biosynthesis
LKPIRERDRELIPELETAFPHRDRTDPRWSGRTGLAVDENPEGMLADLFFEEQRKEGLRFEDLYAIARAPWNANRTGVDVALFNAQAETCFVWWPTPEEVHAGDLVVADLAPHEGFDAQRLNVEWWWAEVRRSAEWVLPEGTLRQVTHESLQSAQPTLDVLGLCRIRDEPRTRSNGQLEVFADRFLPFPRGLLWEELGRLDIALEPIAEGPADSQPRRGVAARIKSPAELLVALANHSWKARPKEGGPDLVSHLATARGNRDVHHFEFALDDLVAGRPLARPRYLAGVWRDGQPEVVRQPLDSDPGAPSAFVFVYDASAKTRNATHLTLPAGWSAEPPVTREELGSVLVPRPPAPGQVRVAIVCDHDWQTNLKVSSEFGDATDVHAGLEAEELGPGIGTLDAYRHSDTDLVYVVPAEDLDIVSAPLLRRVAANSIIAAPLAPRRAPARPRDDTPQVLVVATEWHSRQGGISSFNRGLCKALSRAGAQVECLVGPEEDASIEDTQPVHLTRVETVDGRSDEGAVIQALSEQRAMGLDGVDVVIGHGHITGGAAQRLADRYYGDAIRVHIVHTRPVPVAAAKASEDSTNVLATGEAKLGREQKNARTAQLVCGVGPKLLEEARSLVRAAAHPPPVIELMPGLDLDIPQIKAGWAPGRTIYTVGRVNDAAKGTKVLIDAVARLWKADPRGATLWIRGVPAQDADEEQARLSEQLHEAFVFSYSANTAHLHEDLWRASVMCMPSKEEGFGLVALEAIAAGVPVLVDAHSGLAQVLRTIDADDPAIVDAPPQPKRAVEAWLKKLVAALDAMEPQRERARKRREDLAKHCDWDTTAKRLLREVAKLRSA